MKYLLTMISTCFLLFAAPWTVAAEPAHLAENAEAGQLDPAAGRFLVAQRRLHGRWFSKTVVYLLKHDSEGSVGLIVNRPLDKKVHEVLPGMQSSGIGYHPLYVGGPVSPRIVVMLLKGDFNNSDALQVSEGIYASSSMQILEQMVAAHKPPDELHMFLGQSSWRPGQLVQEIEEDYWFVTEGDPDAIFTGKVDRLWDTLINQLDPIGIVVFRSRL